MPSGRSARSESAPAVLSDGVVVLRTPQSADVDLITEACQDPLIARWTTVPSPYVREAAQAWVDERNADWWATPTWAITAGDAAWAGSIDLRPDGAGSASVGYLVAPWMRRQALATRALRLVCAWGFHVMGLQVITWTAHVENEPSRAVAERVGFRVHRDIARLGLASRGARFDARIGELLPADLQQASASRGGKAESALTRREREVLDLMAAGRANRQIASALGISENPVKNHVRSILDKLHASSRVDAVVRGIQRGETRLP